MGSIDLIYVCNLANTGSVPVTVSPRFRIRFRKLILNGLRYGRHNHYEQQTSLGRTLYVRPTWCCFSSQAGVLV